MTPSPRVDPDTRRALDALRDRAEDRLITGAVPVMTPTTDGEPMIYDDREADPRATEHLRP